MSRFSRSVWAHLPFALTARLADDEVLPGRGGLEKCVEFFQRRHCLASFVARVCITGGRPESRSYIAQRCSGRFTPTSQKESRHCRRICPRDLKLVFPSRVNTSPKIGTIDHRFHPVGNHVQCFLPCSSLRHSIEQRNFCEPEPAFTRQLAFESHLLSFEMRRRIARASVSLISLWRG